MCRFSNGGSLNRRRQEVFKVVGTTHRLRNTDPPTDNRKGRENHQRGKHDPGRLMDAAMLVIAAMAMRVRGGNMVGLSGRCGFVGFLSNIYSSQPQVTKEGHEP